ncbi:MAG TPA: sugar transferase [Terriglobales bacterium]|nr:sugar transferase [Terriglobales bacterium]
MVRRVVDVFGSAMLLLLVSPIFLITACAIWLIDRGPVFYRQTRAGLFGRPFKLLKFRSMRVNNLPAVIVGQVRGDHPMVTLVGRWIRRFKIDELPQLLSVLCGDMALIGPRPTVLEQVEEYSAFQRRRLDIPPGLTGWAQVNGGIEISWPERIMLDVWYVDHRSFWLDMRILWRTTAVILFGEEPNPKSLEEAIAYAKQQAGEAELARYSVPITNDGGNLSRDLTFG